MVVAIVPLTPLGIAGGGSDLLVPSVLAVGFAVGMLSSAIPYTLELEALRRLPAGVFGVLMSLEPAVAALAGFIVLGEDLARARWWRSCSVVAASAGAARGASVVPAAARLAQVDRVGQDPGALATAVAPQRLHAVDARLARPARELAASRRRDLAPSRSSRRRASAGRARAQRARARGRLGAHREVVRLEARTRAAGASESTAM